MQLYYFNFFYTQVSNVLSNCSFKYLSALQLTSEQTYCVTKTKHMNLYVTLTFKSIIFQISQH